MCDSNPIRLIFATSDPDVLDMTTNKYKWSGDMYVKVQCDNRPADFTQLSTSPFTWNFCQSRGCSNISRLNIVFTFKPNSTDPSEFLTFNVDTSGYVISRPENDIKDLSGKDTTLDIENVTRHGENLLEVWLSRGAARGSFLPNLVIYKSQTNWLLIFMVIIVLCILIYLAYVYIDFSFLKGILSNTIKMKPVQAPVSVAIPVSIPHMVL
jgi:hypothetical protein